MLVCSIKGVLLLVMIPFTMTFEHKIFISGLRTCPRPEDPDNGRVVGSDDDQFKPGQKIWFQCNRGYTLVGTKDFRCQDTGLWHPREFPVCVGEHFNNLPALCTARRLYLMLVYHNHNKYT